MKKYLDIPNNGTHRVFCATTKRNIDKKQINAYVKPYILFLQKKRMHVWKKNSPDINVWIGCITGTSMS